MSRLQAGHGLDHNGYIVSDVSKEKIDSIYHPCIQESVAKLRILFSQRLHSVYVYGSVARGDAVVPKSDLDLIALFDSVLSTHESANLKKLAEELSEKYKSLVRDVGIATTYYDYVVDPDNYYEQAFLREISVCVYGEDLRKRFGPYKLTSEIAISFNGDIEKVLARTLTRLNNASGEEFKTITQNFARKLIRTYYSMVMVRSQIWSTRLNDQSKIVLQYFPEKETIVAKLQDWLEEPPTKQESVLELFKQEGKWASDHFMREVKVTSNNSSP